MVRYDAVRCDFIVVVNGKSTVSYTSNSKFAKLLNFLQLLSLWNIDLYGVMPQKQKKKKQIKLANHQFDTTTAKIITRHTYFRYCPKTIQSTFKGASISQKFHFLIPKPVLFPV